MRKKIVYIGIALLAVAIAVYAVSYYTFNQALKSVEGSIVAANYTIAPHGYVSSPVYLGNLTGLVVGANMTKPAYIYVFNKSTFARWSAAANSTTNFSGIASARQLTTNNSFVGGAGLTQVLRYPKNISSGISMQNSTVFVVIDNTNGSPSSNATVYATVLWDGVNTSLQSPLNTGEGGIAASFIIGIAGIIVIIYGALKKSPDAIAIEKSGKPTPEAKEYVDKLYKGIAGQNASQKRKKTGR